MKRRTFLSSAGAAAVLPVLPLSVAAVPAAAAPVSASTANWAALFARVNSRATPALIQKWLGVGPDTAQAIMSDLIKRNVVHAPVAGTAAAVQPMYASRAIPGVPATPSDALKRAKDTFEALVDDTQVDSGAPDDEPKTEDPIDETS